MDEAITEEVVAEVVDGNEADRDEAMEVEGNEIVGNNAVGGNKEVEGKDVNGEEAVGKMRWKKRIMTRLPLWLGNLLKRNVKLTSLVNLETIDICIWGEQCLTCMYGS